MTCPDPHNTGRPAGLLRVATSEFKRSCLSLSLGDIPPRGQGSKESTSGEGGGNTGHPITRCYEVTVCMTRQLLGCSPWGAAPTFLKPSAGPCLSQAAVGSRGAAAAQRLTTGQGTAGFPGSRHWDLSSAQLWTT